MLPDNTSKLSAVATAPGHPLPWSKQEADDFSKQVPVLVQLLNKNTMGNPALCEAILAIIATFQKREQYLIANSNKFGALLLKADQRESFYQQSFDVIQTTIAGARAIPSLNPSSSSYGVVSAGMMQAASQPPLGSSLLPSVLPPALPSVMPPALPFVRPPYTPVLPTIFEAGTASSSSQLASVPSSPSQLNPLNPSQAPATVFAIPQARRGQVQPPRVEKRKEHPGSRTTFHVEDLEAAGVQPGLPASASGSAPASTLTPNPMRS